MNSTRQNQILIVEDSDEDYYATRRAFEQAHCINPLIRAIDGDAALQYLFDSENNPSRLPSVVLLDLNLPGIDGREVLRRIKTQSYLKPIPVIVLTTSLDERDIKACYAAGANSYVKKPVDFPSFVDAVQRLQNYWFELNILPSRGIANLD